jgi:hypothetical protein
VFPQTITLGSPTPVFPDIYIIGLGINGTVNINPTVMIAKYARTWREVSPLGVVGRQVWRFLVNADVMYQLPAGATSPCPYPKVAFLQKPCHFIGSVDYSRDCLTGTWSASVNLTYLCGDFMHPTFSVNPITPNPNLDHMYSFVGPLPFLWGFGAPPAGSSIADSVRADNYNLGVSPLLWQPLSEVPTAPGGILANVTQYCACLDPSGPSVPRWYQQKLNFQYGCIPTANSWSAIPWAPLMPTGLSAFPLGTWAVPAGTFPGAETVSLYMGAATAPDPCVAGFPFHLVTGVGTTGGDLAIVDTLTFPGGPVTTTDFLDLENMLVLIGGPPYVAIGIGGLFLSSELWSLNF